jgi:hypothetical protein
MNTHKLLLGSVASVALLAAPAFAQDAQLGADGNPVVIEGDAGALGGQIVVEQPDAEVDVTVADPVVTVDQARPEVLVEQGEAEVTVRVPEPTVTVEQQAPIITIEQAQPEVLVTIPEPTITVRMPEPNVNVATGEPQVDVQQPEPIVRFVRPEPRITIEESEPNVQVTSADPQVTVNRAEAARVAVEQAEADVNVETEGEGNVQVTEAEPEVNIEQAEGADVTVDQADPNIQIDQAEADVTVDGEADAMASSETGLVVGDEPAGGLYAAFADARVADLVGTNVTGENGNDIGEIDRLISNGQELLAIVGVGGFLGLGEQDVAIPLDRFSMTDNGLVLDTVTEREIEAMPEWNGSGDALPLDTTIGNSL